MQDEPISAARKAMREFLHPEFIGCRFAPDVFKTEDRVYWNMLGEDEIYAKALTDLLAKSEEKVRLAAALFPSIKSTAALAAMLRAVGDTERWVLELATTLLPKLRSRSWICSGSEATGSVRACSEWRRCFLCR